MEEKIINLIRLISLMISRTHHGHIGSFLSSAPILYVLFFNIMKYNPNNPNLLSRDRFILSNGHAHLIYCVINYMVGGKITNSNLKNFNSIKNVVATHPHYNLKYGIETTTGPLGQGISNAVGMAIGFLRQKLISGNESPYVYCVVGDGCLMEGISYESMSLAGKLKLNNLILLYDSNNATIDGDLKYSTIENIKKRCESMDWAYFNIKNGNTDFSKIEKTIEYAKELNKPVLIEVKTNIAFKTSYHNSNAGHHPNKINLTDLEYYYKNLGINKDLTIENLDDLLTSSFDYNLQSFINKKKNDILKRASTLKDEFKIKKVIKPKFSYNKSIERYINLRDISGKIIQKLYNLDNIILGSADLSYSTFRLIPNNYKDLKQIPFGIREHAMAGIANGISTTGFIPIISTLLIFSSYLLPSLRLAALSKFHVIYIFCLDSVRDGSNGPTHCPVEQLTQLRSIPNVLVLRPGNYNEVVVAYELALKNKKGPTCICIANTDCPDFYNDPNQIKKGAYIVYQNCTDENLDKVILATGTEISLIHQTLLGNKIKNCRLVSFFSETIFELQDKNYKEKIIPANCTIIAIEAGHSSYWHKYATKIYSIDKFPDSGNGSELYSNLGFTEDKLNHFLFDLNKNKFNNIILSYSTSEQRRNIIDYINKNIDYTFIQEYLTSSAYFSLTTYYSLILHLDNQYIPNNDSKSFPRILYQDNKNPIICHSETIYNNLQKSKNIICQEPLTDYKHFELAFNIQAIEFPFIISKKNNELKFEIYKNQIVLNKLNSFIDYYLSNVVSKHPEIIYIKVAYKNDNDFKFLGCKIRKKAYNHLVTLYSKMKFNSAILCKDITQLDCIYNDNNFTINLIKSDF
ncbi:Transketolase, thiamine diphosphate binding domain [seawater metagenome]|uniref:Transketolase, thiamine diphosphate binding domain n=1 Tax=seawater metagenome TaxID=1561972 RepID=A0A5E8CK91_9ZZZZ